MQKLPVPGTTSDSGHFWNSDRSIGKEEGSQEVRGTGRFCMEIGQIYSIEEGSQEALSSGRFCMEIGQIYSIEEGAQEVRVQGSVIPI